MQSDAEKKYIVIGTGALGGFFGAKLCKAGLDVHFLLRSDYEHVKRNGLKVLSRYGDIILDNINCYNNPSDMPKGDVILVAIKTFSNNELKNILPKILKDSSNVILLQNGIGSEEYLTDIIEITRIYGGLSILAVSKDSPGVINHHDYGSVKIGQFNPDGFPRTISMELLEIVSDFEKAGIPASPVSDLMQARWEKLIWNIPFSGLSVILDADTRQLISNPDSLELVRDIIKDTAKASEACGKIIQPDFQHKMVDITVKMTPFFPSMKQDYDSGKQMEIEAIFGNPLAAAKKAGYNAPWISMLYQLLKTIEKKRL